MSPMSIDLTRRHLMASGIVAVAGIAAGGVAMASAAGTGGSAGGGASQGAKAGAGGDDRWNPSVPAVPAVPPPGKPGDFDFLHGEWRIAHRQLKSAKDGEWIEYEGEATCWTILGGVGSVEELRIPARNFSGMGLRLLDLEKKLWSDFWVNGRSGVLAPPGLTGHFVEGVGVFIAEDSDNGKPILARGVWDRIAEGRCRWHQSVSRDAGKTWDYNWFMDWTRIGPPRSA
ncbi:MAG: hypothetical protein KA144_00365 [Xanthomonadaceae bacterium]|nr:hypothetical protein [Xanthomonadaceae bacterium]